MAASPKILIVTPARNEAECLPRTIACVRDQSILPTCWVIVDDGSSDGTSEIVSLASQETSFIRLAMNSDRGFRSPGTGVVEAFYCGLEAAADIEFDFIVKLDADLVFAADYFERCVRQFEEDPGLGIGGGVIFNTISGERVLEQHPDFHVRGATKIYRRECWDAIGGLFRVPGWDTLDEVKAQMLGWRTRSFPEIEVDQLRMTGGPAGQWRNWQKNGRACFISGYDALYLVARAARKLLHLEVTAGIGLLVGYFGASLSRVSKVDDPELLDYVKTQQRRRLTGRKTVWR